MKPCNNLIRYISLLPLVLAAVLVSALTSCVSDDLRLSRLNLKALQHNVYKEYDQAIALYTRLIEEGYFLQGIYNGRGSAYEYKGDYEQALDDYTRAIEHGGHHISRAQLFQKMGDYEKAAADWSRVDPRQRPCSHQPKPAGGPGPVFCYGSIRAFLRGGP